MASVIIPPSEEALQNAQTPQQKPTAPMLLQPASWRDKVYKGDIAQLGNLGWHGLTRLTMTN